MTQEDPLLVEESYEPVRGSGVESTGIQVFCQDKERLGVALEEFNVKNGLWEGQVIFLKVVV